MSLFRAVTLEDWTDLMYIQMYGCDEYGYGGMEAMCTAPSASPVGGALFFVTFVLFGTMIILNLFIGVILSGMDEAQRDADDEVAARRPDGPLSMAEELSALEKQLADFQAHVARVQRAAAKELAEKTVPESREPPTMGAAPAPAE